MKSPSPNKIIYHHRVFLWTTYLIILDLNSNGSYSPQAGASQQKKEEKHDSKTNFTNATQETEPRDDYSNFDEISAKRNEVIAERQEQEEASLQKEKKSTHESPKKNFNISSNKKVHHDEEIDFDEYEEIPKDNNAQKKERKKSVDEEYNVIF